MRGNIDRNRKYVNRVQVARELGEKLQNNEIAIQLPRQRIRDERSPVDGYRHSTVQRQHCSSYREESHGGGAIAHNLDQGQSQPQFRPLRHVCSGLVCLSRRMMRDALQAQGASTVDCMVDLGLLEIGQDLIKLTKSPVCWTRSMAALSSLV